MDERGGGGDVNAAAVSSRASARVTPPLPLECLEWPVALSVLAYGVRIGVRANDARLADEVAAHLGGGTVREAFGGAERVYSLVVDEDEGSGELRGALYVDGRPRVRRAKLEALLRAFESDLQIHVAEMATDRVFVHAGVVGWQGRGILVPGRSFSGKSTLVAELIRAGAEYYSDEYAVLDLEGIVHPYARPLAIRQADGVKRVPATALGGQAGSDPMRVGLVLVSKFRAGAEWRPQSLSPGRGALALMANTVPARRIPGTVLATLHRVVAGAAVVASERGEASDVVDSILELAALSSGKSELK